jgi:hypothetical protein
MQLNIQKRDPVHLKNKYTTALRRLPELPEDSEEFRAIAAGLKKAGFIRPILIDENDCVIDDHSRTLLKAAIRWQLVEIPVQVCNSTDAPNLLLHSLIHVRHLSKSAIAYLAYPHLQPAIEASRLRRLENLRNSQQISEEPLSGSSSETIGDLAEQVGISSTLLKAAKQVHEAFADKKKYTFNVDGGAKDGAIEEVTLKEWYEPKLLQAYVGGEHEQSRPIGLGGILAGITAVRTGDRAKFSPKGKQTDFFADLFTRDIQKFNALPELKREAAMSVIEKTAEQMTPQECEAAAETLRAMANVYAAAAKVKK